MFNKKCFLIFTGYIAGIIISSVFNDKKGSDFKKELCNARKKGTDAKNMILDNIIETHKNLLLALRSKTFNEKKEELLDHVEEYKKEGLKIIDDLKGSGVKYLSDTKTKLEILYKEKLNDIENLKSEAPEKIDEIKSILKKSFESLKNKVK